MTHTTSHRQVDLSRFDNSDFDRGASLGRELTWILFREAVFERGPLPMSRPRAFVLSCYGAVMGRNVTIRQGFRVTFPWKLEVGDNCWLGEDSWLLNLAPIRLGKNVVVSQRAFLCTGNHDWAASTFDLKTAEITVEDGAWIGAAAFIGPGVTIGSHAVITAGSVVTRDMPPYMICAGNPCAPVRPRRIER